MGTRIPFLLHHPPSVVFLSDALPVAAHHKGKGSVVFELPHFGSRSPVWQKQRLLSALGQTPGQGHASAGARGGSMGSGHRGGSSLGSCKPPGLAGVGDRVRPHTCVLFKACTGARLTLKYCPGWGRGSVTAGYLGKGRSGAFWPPMGKPRGSAAAPHPSCPSRLLLQSQITPPC